MWFKSVFEVRGLLVGPGVMEIPCGGPGGMLVEIQRADPDTPGAGVGIDPGMCVIRGQYAPTAQEESIFTDLAQGIAPKEWHDNSAVTGAFASDGHLKPDVLLPLDQFPEHFQQFVGHVEEELFNQANVAVGILRWRYHIPGPHDRLRPHSSFWSVDGEHWQRLPRIIRMVGNSVSSFPLTDVISKEVARLLADGRAEPVAHELYREASTFRDSHRRSALLLVVAAVEVGLKQCISELVQDSQWLVENLPSPPVVKMLKKYLPQLPVKCRIDGKVVLPPKETLATLTNAIELRNTITHVGQGEPSPETLDEVFRAAEDTLWLLDYYRGCGWALNYVHPETRRAMGMKL